MKALNHGKYPMLRSMWMFWDTPFGIYMLSGPRGVLRPYRAERWQNGQLVEVVEHHNLIKFMAIVRQLGNGHWKIYRTQLKAL